MTTQATTRNARQKARKAALQAMYALDLEHNWDPDRFAALLLQQNPPLVDEGLQYGIALFETFQSHGDEVDDHIDNLNPAWSLERMGIVERNLLRLAFTELWYFDTPRAVSIAEGIRLAELFASSEAIPFIHAVLDQSSQPDTTP